MHPETIIKISKKCCKLENGVADNAILIVGVANAGLVGTIAASHLIEQLDLKEVAHLHSSLFPPISVFMDGVLKNPFRIYADVDTGKPATIFLATTELPLNKETFHEVAHVLLDFTDQYEVKTIVTLVGFPVQDVDDHQVFYAAEPELMDRLKEFGDIIKPLPKGMIYGMEALVLNEALERDLDGFTLIVPVKEYLPAASGAAALIEAMNKIFDHLDVDVKELLEQDKLIQSKLQELAMQVQRSQEPDQYMAPPPSRNMNSLFT